MDKAEWLLTMWMLHDAKLHVRYLQASQIWLEPQQTVLNALLEKFATIEEALTELASNADRLRADSNDLAQLNVQFQAAFPFADGLGQTIANATWAVIFHIHTCWADGSVLVVEAAVLMEPGQPTPRG